MSPYDIAAPGLPDPDLHPGFYSGTVPKRFFAWLVDTVIVGLFVGIAVLFTVFIGLFFLPVLWLSVEAVYRIITMTGRSATLGQRLFGIEFRDHAGRRFALPQAAVHVLGYLVSMSFLIPQVISIVMMMVNARGQGLADMLLGNAAINRPAERL